MYIIVGDTKNEISSDDPIDDRNGNKKVGLIRAYFIFSFYEPFSVRVTRPVIQGSSESLHTLTS